LNRSRFQIDEEFLFEDNTNNTYVIWLGSRKPNEHCTVITYYLSLLQILIDVSLFCFPLEYEKESETFYIPSQIWSFIIWTRAHSSRIKTVYVLRNDTNYQTPKQRLFAILLTWCPFIFNRRLTTFHLGVVST